MQSTGKNVGDPGPGAQPLMPLAMARPGETVELVDVRGGLGLQRRLAEMGLGPGSRFTVETS
ncbi:MAG: ferrous iron transport protein A, partial [Phycisphaerae bacterium]|nr:ferrous iron transport protein A [Phycisphaerae bacterium]